jgi:hypothetical protein
LARDRAGNEVVIPIACRKETRRMKLGYLPSARSPKLR